jgi:hypothetical protein
MSLSVAQVPQPIGLLGGLDEDAGVCKVLSSAE